MYRFQSSSHERTQPSVLVLYTNNKKTKKETDLNKKTKNERTGKPTAKLVRVCLDVKKILDDPSLGLGAKNRIDTPPSLCCASDY